MTVAALATVFAVSAFVPAVAFGQGNLVDDLVKGVQGILGGGGGGTTDGGGAVEPQAGSPPNYTPPLHGSNPHGQGSPAVVDLAPSSELPLSGDPAGGAGSGEEVVLGRTRGEQDENGDYHGHVTILSLLGTELIPGPDTNEGESFTGPFGPLQTVLNDICTASGNTLCVTLLDASSTTTDTSSTNHFQTLGVNVGTAGQQISASAVTSNGNISESGGCQTAHGDSSVANASVLGIVTAGAAESSSDSQACSNGTTTQNQDSSVVTINSVGLGVPVQGCADGTPDSNFTPLLPLLGAVCNADDANGAQTSSPYGVREALSAFVLAVLPGVEPLVKATTGASESHAVAPADTTPPTTPTTPTTPADGGDGGGDDGGPGGPGKGGEGAGPAAGDAQAGDEDLAFTGANMFVLALIGGMLIVGGLGLARASTRRHRLAA